MHRRLFLKFVPSIPFASFTNTLYFLSCICNDPLSTKKFFRICPLYAIGKIDDSQISFITFKKLSLNPSCLRGLLTISDWDKIRKGLTNSLHYDVGSFFLSLINHIFFLSMPYLPQIFATTQPVPQGHLIEKQSRFTTMSLFPVWFFSRNIFSTF